MTDRTRQEIANHVAKLEPSAQAEIEIDYTSIGDDKDIIVITVNAGNHVPYSYDGRSFLRNQSTTARMTQHRLEQLIVKRGQLNYSWEDFIADGYTIDSLDHEEIYKTITDGVREGRAPASAQKEGVKEILVRLNLMKDGNLTNAAVVLYAKPEFAPYMIKMARFKGLDKLGEFIDNQQIYGNAFKPLSDADAFLKRHLPIASFFKPNQFKRVDQPILPVMAVREALINAICHRQYDNFATDIALAIFDQKLELWNSGVLLDQLTVADLKRRHSSILRNKHIANVFYVRGLIEKWGIGTNKMIELCKQDDVPEPEFQEYSGGLSVTFRFREPMGVSFALPAEISKHNLTTRQIAIVKILSSGIKMSLNQIVQQLDNAPASRTVGDDLAYLKSLKLVTTKGVGRGSKWLLLNARHEK